MITLFGHETQPAVPPLLAVMVCLLLVAITGVSYWRVVRDHPVAAGVLCVGRCVLLIALLALLLNPVRQQQAEPRAEKPPLWVMLDTSRSMHTRDISGSARITAASHELIGTPLAEQLEQHYDVRWYALGERYLPITKRDVQQNAASALLAGHESNLASQLSAAVLEISLAAQRVDQPAVMLVISDGRDTAGGDFAAVGKSARDLGVTINTVAVGRTRYLRDVSVSAIPLQPTVFTGETFTVAATVRHAGFDGRSVRVRLVEYKDGQPVVHDVKRIALEAPATGLQLSMQAAQPGDHVLAVDVQGFDDEPIAENNMQPVVVQVRDRPASVLMIDGRPDFDSRALAQALRSDVRFELTQIIRLSPAKVQLITSSSEAATGDPLKQIPQSAETFAEYDVVILGSHVDRLLSTSAADALVQYVNDGGAVLLSHASELATVRSAAGPLGVLQPAQLSSDETTTDAAVRSTDSGLQHPALAALASAGDSAVAMPSLSIRMPQVTARRGSETLLEAVRSEAAGASPALVAMNVGSGKAAAMYGSEWWRWRLRPTRQSAARQWHDTMWQDLVRWLVSEGEDASSRITLDVQPSVMRVGEAIELRVRYRWAPGDVAPPELVVTHESGQAQTIATQLLLGESATYRASFTPDRPGRYVATAAAPHQPNMQAAGVMVAVDDVTEQLQSQPDRPALAVLAERTLGKSLVVESEGDAQQIGRLFEKGDDALTANAGMRHAAGLQGWVMIVMLAWLAMEWLSRRRYGWS